MCTEQWSGAPLTAVTQCVGAPFRSADRPAAATHCVHGRPLLLRSFLASSVHETEARTAHHTRTCDCASCVVSRSHIGLTGRPSRFSVSP
jgi:hypothetical protein